MCELRRPRKNLLAFLYEERLRHLRSPDRLQSNRAGFWRRLSKYSGCLSKVSSASRMLSKLRGRFGRMTAGQKMLGNRRSECLSGVSSAETTVPNPSRGVQDYPFGTGSKPVFGLASTLLMEDMEDRFVPWSAPRECQRSFDSRVESRALPQATVRKGCQV